MSTTDLNTTPELDTFLSGSPGFTIVEFCAASNPSGKPSLEDLSAQTCSFRKVPARGTRRFYAYVSLYPLYSNTTLTYAFYRSDKYDIASTPTFALFQGKELVELVLGDDLDTITSAIKKHYPLPKEESQEPLDLPEKISAPALDCIWNSPALATTNSRALPPPTHLEDALSQLRITLLSKTQHKAVHVVEGSELVEPTLAFFCPIEGGEYVIDATVKELAKKTNSDVQVIDMMQVAAGEWGVFGKLASGFRIKKNPLGKVKLNEDLDACDTDTKNIKALEVFWRKLLESNPPAPAKTSSESTPTSESNVCPPKPRSRIVYIRDYGLLAHRVDTWFPPLYSALRTLRAQGLGPSSPITIPTTVVFGMSPRISSVFPTGAESGGCTCDQCRPPSQDWDESATKERAKRLKALKEKWDKGTILNELPAFKILLKIPKSVLEAEKESELPKQETKDDDKAVEKPDAAVEQTTEKEAPQEKADVEDKDKVEEEKIQENDKTEKKEEPKPEAKEKTEGSEDTSDSDSDSDEPDESSTHFELAINGYFRSCVIAPAKRNSKLERAARENRRKELNELMVRMTIGVKGGQMEAAPAPIPVKDEVKDKESEVKDEDKSKEDDIMHGWDERILSMDALKNVVNRALETAMLSNEDDNHQELIRITWTQLQDAWKAKKKIDEERKAWTKTGEDSDEEHTSEDDDEKKEDKPPVDEVVEKVKSADLDEYEKRLIGCIVDVAKLSTTFENVHLPSQVIDSVRSIVSLPLIYPEAFKSGILKQQAISGALLFGPPGTGKTLVVRALAKESGSRMLAIKPSDVADKWVGETEKLVRSLFKLARRLKPCVVFIDEIDSIMGSRMGTSSSGGSRWHTSMLTEFMQEMDGLLSSSVIVIGATNRPFDVDDAVLRRLPCRLLVDLPGVEAREEILKITLKDDELAPDVSIKDLARKTDRFSGSDLKRMSDSYLSTMIFPYHVPPTDLCVAAAMDALKEGVKLPWLAKNDKPDEGSPSKANIANDPELKKEDLSDDETPPLKSDPNSESPSAASTGVTTPEEKPEAVKPRVLFNRHFVRALMDVAPSSSESQGAMSELRKWNTQFGTGARDQPRTTGSLPYNYGGSKSYVPGSSSVPGLSGVPGYNPSGLGSTGSGSSSFNSPGFGPTGLGSGRLGVGSLSGLGSSGLGGSGPGSGVSGPSELSSTSLGSTAVGSLSSLGLGASSLGSLTGMAEERSGTPSTKAYPPSTYTPPSIGVTSAGYTPKFPVYNRNIAGYTPSTSGGGTDPSAPGS
ncbi:AAA family ATPase [Ceratobasidium sp. AG-Ba]|nr:AAA family ATPase [Ceratobasidium sp. AG-Ba]